MRLQEAMIQVERWQATSKWGEPKMTEWLGD